MQKTNDERSTVRPGRLLVLDDEAEMRNMLARFLIGHGFEVRTVKDSSQLDVFLERQPYDLLVLDVMMPNEDGLSVCRRLRAQGQSIPILMLTARGDPIERVVGLETGADDYLAKPFLPSELVARIRAILRRQEFVSRQQMLRGDVLGEREQGFLRFGPFRLDLGQRELYKDDRVVTLNAAEMSLLCSFAVTPNRPISRSNLLERARGRAYEANTRSVDVQVLRLRQIVEVDASAPRFIRTVWGVGYMFVAEIES